MLFLNRRLLKIIAIILVCLSGLNSISLADGNSLSTWTSMERPEVKREAMAAMYRQSRLIWTARSEKYLNLLRNYNALALLLPSGRYLMAPETASNNLSLIRAATHEDYEILMQREEKLRNTRYQRLLSYVLNNNEIMRLYRALSHYKKYEEQPDNIIFNDLIAKAFEILFLLEQKLIHPASELTENEKKFINLMQPVLKAKDIAGGYKNFPQLFFDINKRAGIIRNLQKDKNSRFYRVTSNEGEDIRDISYLLDQVEYAKDMEIRNAMNDPYQARLTIIKFFRGEGFYIQNNRKLTRNSMCSGRCWYCYAHRIPLQKRLKETSPMQIPDAVAIVGRAIDMGFTSIQLNGEDTLDDLESFWAIVDACKDKPVRFSFFTNGFYLMRRHEQSLEFFKQLRRRLGDVLKFELTLSWDHEKVARAKEFSEFAGNEDAVFKAMAHVIHNFNEVFPISTEGILEKRYSLSIDMHDLGTGDEVRAQENYDEFNKKLWDTFLSYRSHNYTNKMLTTGRRSLEIVTPEAVREAIKRGRVTKQFTVEELFRKMVEKHKSTCAYLPLFDMSMSEMVTCLTRHEYPRRVVTPEILGDVLLKPFSNPRSRHLYIGGINERKNAFVKQLGFALALDPALKGEMQVSFEEVESFIFSNEELMTKIEMLYLLEDFFYTERGRGELYRLSRVPKELIEPLLNTDLLNALLIYYDSYRTGGYPEILSQIIAKFHNQPHEAVSELQDLLRNVIIPRLKESGAISAETAEKAPAGFTKSATTGKFESLPTLENLGHSDGPGLKRTFESLNSTVRKSDLNKPASQFSGTCQKTYDISGMRFYVPVEIMKNSADVTITLNRVGMLNSSIKEGSVLFELIVTGVTDNDMALISGLNRKDVKEALNLPENLKVGIISENEIRERAKLAIVDAADPKNRAEIIKQLSLEARPLEQGEVMAIVTDAVTEEKAKELEALLKPELADNISIRIAVSPESGKSIFSLSSIISDWLKDIHEGRKSTINIVLPAILSPAEMIRQLENAVRSAWRVLAAA